MSAVSEVLIPLAVCAGLVVVVTALTLGAMLFIGYVRGEIYHATRVCPIWSETLNELMDSDVPVERRPAQDWVALGPVIIFVGDYPDNYGHESGHRDYPDRKTQKRLKEYIARKHAIEIFDKVADNLNVAKNP
jgi:hypothetical protein